MSICEFGSLKRFVGTKEHQAAAEAETRSCQQQTPNTPDTPDTPDTPETPSLLDSRSKLFEIEQCGSGKVLFTYRVKPELDTEPAIWLYLEDPNGIGNWYHLADSFTKYFRIMLVYLGLPLWQYCAVGISLPTWVEQIYYLVAPHLLSTTVKPLESISASLWKDGPTNIIDPTIFKVRENKQRNSRKK